MDDDLPTEKTVFVSDNDREAENLHLMRVTNTFKFYRAHSLRNLRRKRAYFLQLPASHQQQLSYFESHLEAVRSCIEHNSLVLQAMLPDVCDSPLFLNSTLGAQGQCEQDSVETATDSDVPNNSAAVESDPLGSFESGESGGENCNNCSSTSKDALSADENKKAQPTNADFDKVRTTLKQIVRDWSEDGSWERRLAYDPILADLQRLLPGDPFLQNRHQIKVLVPGAGLGRLAWEITRLGYSCEGNEWSYYMLLVSNFILNSECCREVNGLSIYPWAHQWCNVRRRNDQLRLVRFPDVDPWQIVQTPNAKFSMAAGDFLTYRSSPNEWDCVTTVFFLDTAHNPLAYIETVWEILRPGGYWLNLGPLLWHYCDVPGEMSLELAYEDLKEAIVRLGFEVLSETPNVRCSYTQDTASMLMYEYDCVYFVCRKPVAADSLERSY